MQKRNDTSKRGKLIRRFWVAVAASGCMLLPLAASAQPADASSDLINQLRFVRFHIAFGRIVGASPQFDRNTTLNHSRQQRQERLSIALADGQPTIDYSLKTPEVELTINLRDGRDLELRRAYADAAKTSVNFRQQGNAPLALELTAEGQTRALQSPTMWHLLLAHPDDCRKHLTPLLGMLRPDWEALPLATEKIELALLRSSGAPRVSERERWGKLVAELASDEYHRRQLADRQLRQAGQSVLPFLQGLDAAQLDAEQRYRIRMMVESMSGNFEDDNPSNVALWLVSDPSAWFALLDRREIETRRVALDQLKLLLSGESLDFDPAAAEDARTAQLDKLRPRFAAPPDTAATPRP